MLETCLGIAMIIIVVSAIVFMGYITYKAHQE
jgi:hypothetical protein